MLQLILRSFVVTACLAVVLCGAYPMAVTVVAKVFFPRQAGGSLIVSGKKTLGSELIAQGFESEKYFHPRPSAVGYAETAALSGATNLGPLSPALAVALKTRAAELLKSNPDLNPQKIPTDLITASGSGLDPHISPAAALAQISRIAKARGLKNHSVEALVRSRIEKPFLGILGEARVNVLLLNLELDGRSESVNSRR